MRPLLARSSLLLLGVGAALTAAGVCLLVRRSAEGSATLPDLTVVHLTDLHLSSSTTPTTTPWTHKIIIGGYKLHQPCLGKTSELLATAVQLVNTCVRPDAVVVTGDVVNRGDDTAALRQARELLCQVQAPVIIARGDHDLTAKPENQALSAALFEPLDGQVEVRGRTFHYLPLDPSETALIRLREGIAATPPGSLHVLCLHRMLQAPPLLRWLSRKYTPTVLSPRSNDILEILRTCGRPVMVLCGHAHTNYRAVRQNVTHLCTASLAEYPHELRIITVRGGRVRTQVVTLRQLAAVARVSRGAAPEGRPPAGSGAELR
jgi:predicted MPP superfamily phosphohydrolase